MKYLLLSLAFFLPALVLAQDTGYVPLTNIPILYEVGNAFSLDQYLNNLYKILIGAAAVIAVLKIMFEGVRYMGGDSVTEKKSARDNIGMAIGGLILVLSPVIVFSIINPEILSLKLDAGGLAPTENASSTPQQAVINASSQAQCELYDRKIAPAGSQCAAVGTGYASISPICCGGLTQGATCCAKLKTTDTGADQPSKYGWRGTFQKDGATSVQQQGGNFNSSAECNASLTSWPQANGYASTGDFTCTCSTPISQQPSCTGF